MTLPELLAAGPRVANLGVHELADGARAAGAEVIDVAWTPPPKLDDDVAALLEELL